MSTSPDVREVIESLDGPADPEVEEAWRAEIERRIGQIDRSEVQLIPGDEVFARLRRRLRMME
jgi:putative addiction module component (TIGR02574 family)